MMLRIALAASCLLFVAKAQNSNSVSTASDYARVRELLKEYYSRASRAYGHDYDPDAIQSDVSRQRCTESNEVCANKRFWGDLFENDIVLTLPQAENLLDETNRRGKRQAQPTADSFWRTLNVPFFFGFADSTWQTLIRGALKHVEQETCIRFTENGAGYDRIMYIRGSGCWSNVGRIGGTQQVSIGYGCDALGIVAHETLHALGLWHEQSRVDRDSYIFINPGAIIRGTEGNFQKRTPDTSDNMGQPYDLGSVMHYSPKSFSNDYSTPTISTRDPRYQRTIGQREGVSFKDAKMINLRYCNRVCPYKLNCLHGGYTDPNNCNQCKCPSGYGGAYCDQVQRTSRNCGGELTADYNTKQLVSGNVYADTHCVWRIKSPAGQKVEVNVEKVNFVCRETCAGYVEVKYQQNKEISGARLCCEEQKTVILSETDEVIIIFKGEEGMQPGYLGFELRYRFYGATTTTSPPPTTTTRTTTTTTPAPTTTTRPTTTTTTTTRPPPTTTTAWWMATTPRTTEHPWKFGGTRTAGRTTTPAPTRPTDEPTEPAPETTLELIGRVRGPKAVTRSPFMAVKTPRGPTYVFLENSGTEEPDTTTEPETTTVPSKPESKKEAFLSRTLAQFCERIRKIQERWSQKESDDEVQEDIALLRSYMEKEGEALLAEASAEANGEAESAVAAAVKPRQVTPTTTVGPADGFRVTPSVVPVIDEDESSTEHIDEGAEEKEEEKEEEVSPNSGQWSAWSEWSRCSEPCGGCGRRRRVRICVGGTTGCGGFSSQLQPCNSHVCIGGKNGHVCSGRVLMPCTLAQQLHFGTTQQQDPLAALLNPLPKLPALRKPEPVPVLPIPRLSPEARAPAAAYRAGPISPYAPRPQQQQQHGYVLPPAGYRQKRSVDLAPALGFSLDTLTSNTGPRVGRQAAGGQQMCEKRFTYYCPSRLLTIHMDWLQTRDFSGEKSDSPQCCTGYYASDGKCYKNT